MKIWIFLTVSLLSVLAVADQCPQPASAITPEVSSSIQKDESGNYIYKYSVSNGQEAKVPIRLFWVETQAWPQEVKSPLKWRTFEEAKTSANYVNWMSSVRTSKISPGQKLDGFEFTTKDRPGLIRAFVLGHNPNYEDKVAYTDVPRAENTSCPGIWEDGSSVGGNGKVAVLIEGPVSKNQVSPVLVLRKNSKESWAGSISETETLHRVSPLDNGKLELLIVPDENQRWNLADIEISSLVFGRGEAKPSSSRIIKGSYGNFANPGLGKTIKSALLLTFDIEKVNPLCGIDRALFLKGKLKDGKELISGVKIKGVPCTIETWVKEVPKILKHREPSKTE
ncbi:hypothetical protein AZI86_07825 [Bdellovibrio bacteriovorus]|uniref:Uncharacterized protein n=1 Tax=Bdellovibrio bacteriovorus TaxID=959 RepID=A0A150WRU8_BDEBC|nr:hypothetical protein [Bdellovibrio bacteriovorus]KYG66925.1 hypothetical protein AZI86_07825 [Bdellovibrio bacteriovorus]